MGVYFALRTHYGYPTGKYLRYFSEDESVLAWFQKRWQGFDDTGDSSPAWGYVKEMVGAEVYGFASLFTAIAEHKIPVPRTTRGLAAILRKHLYVEGEILISTHAIQVLTDDDELELAYYFFDDHYLEKEPEKAAYLLHEDWELPTDTELFVAVRPTTIYGETLPSGGSGVGVVYVVFLSFYDSSNLTDLDGVYRIPGIRLPQLMAYLRDSPPGEGWVVDLELLRALTATPGGQSGGERTLHDALNEAATIPIAEIDDVLYKMDFGKGKPSEDRARLAKVLVKNPTTDALKSGKYSLVQTEEHIAQLCLHSGTWSLPSGDISLYYRWIFFDDVWLSAHPALGKAILRFGTRWDVLT
ncbi:MAG: hypothetical protein H8F28_20230 [Fibrella sp.]|nr:hypothetical protein [Armatimonadota bacterium]